MVRRKRSLTPITEEMKLENAVKEAMENPRDENHIVDGSNIDTYLQMSAENGTLESTDMKVENEMLKDKITKLNEKIDNLENNIKNISKEKYNLMLENTRMKNKLNNNNEIIELRKSNEDLLLKISEVNLENTKLKQSNKNLQQQIDDFNHVGTKNGYDDKFHIKNRTGFITGNDGYQQWI